MNKLLRKHYSKLGKKSARCRFRGKTKKEISEMMSKVRKG